MTDDPLRLTEQLSRQDELHRDQAVTDLEAVLRSREGRRVLLSVLERCGVFRIAYTGQDSATNLRLGEQNIGLWLIARIEEVGPTEYPALLLYEAQRRANEKEGVRVLDVAE